MIVIENSEEIQAGNAEAPEAIKSQILRRSYVPPTLTHYGSVSVLTKGTATVGTDSGFNNSRKNPQSDIRVKENIVRVGEHPLGIGLYLFDYKPEFRDSCGHGRQFGVMAQEVQTVMPGAVALHTNGYKMVDYDMLGIQRPIH